MKKIILILIIMVIGPLSAFAECLDYQCVKPYDLVSPFPRVLLNLTGLNIVAEQYGQSLIKKIIKKSAATNMKVDLQSFSMIDLKAGRFKSLELSGKNIEAEGIYISSLTLKTLCDFNYIVPDEANNTVTFKEDFPMSFNVVVSDEDLNKTMKSIGYDKIISDLNDVSLKYGTMVKIESARAKIKNGRFVYAIRIAVPFVRNIQEIVISSDLKVKNGTIKLEDTKLMGGGFSVDLSKLSYALNFLNPLDYSLNIIENKNAKLKVSNVCIEDDKIMIDGVVIMPKDIVTQR